MTSLSEKLWDRAAETSADYVEQYINSVLLFRKKEDIWRYVASILDEHSSGLGVEFGVYKGTSINFFAQQLPNWEFVGFDSFEGLPDNWNGHCSPRGAFNLEGDIPAVKANVRLVKGWFSKTLSKEAKILEKANFFHIDSDTYDSCKYILDVLESYSTKNKLILFDEYLGYPNWQNGEHRALQEANLNFDYLAFADQQCLVRLK